MKSAFRPFLFATTTAVLLLAGSTLSLPAADAPPSLTIRKVIELGEQSLAEKGLSKDVYIVSAGMKRTTVASAPSVWEVLWSSPIQGSKPGSKEVGLEISMSGEVTHLLKGRGPAGIPAKPR